MTIRPFSKLTKFIGFASLAIVASIATIGVGAADTTNVSLDITGGQLTVYAGDDNGTTNPASPNAANHDICTPANITGSTVVDTTVSGGSASSVTCSTNENSLLLTGLTVASSRQSATARLDDVVFEDLRGLATSSYTITATVSDFTAGVGKDITLGQNPDTVTSDADADAPTLTDANKLFAAVNASGGTLTVLRDATAITEGVTNYTKGSNTTVVSSATPVTLLSTTAAVRPGRVALDGTTVKLRVPALVQAGSYTGTITQTIV